MQVWAILYKSVQANKSYKTYVHAYLLKIFSRCKSLDNKFYKMLKHEKPFSRLKMKRMQFIVKERTGHYVTYKNKNYQYDFECVEARETSVSRA